MARISRYCYGDCYINCKTTGILVLSQGKGIKSAQDRARCGWGMKGKQTMDDRWPVWKLALMLYVFAAGAVAINLFMLGLLGHGPGVDPVGHPRRLGVGDVGASPDGRGKLTGVRPFRK